jgi:hypothetical protein
MAARAEAGSADPKPRSAYEGLTVRSAAAGVALSALIGIADPYSKHVLRSTYLASDFMPLGLVFPFVLLVTVVNGTLKAIRRSWGFRPSELVIVFAMGLVATTIPTVGLTGTLLTTMTSPFYYATPENNWSTLFLDRVPRWLAPVSDEGTAIRWFFEGLPPDQRLPWEVWAGPLFWWLSLVAAVLLGCTCIVVILRRQWVDKERLPYPLAEVPLLLAEESDRPGFLAPFMRSRLFWAGFAIPMFLLLWNAAGFFNPTWPTIQETGNPIVISREFPPIPVRIYYPVLGFAYLINVQVALSIWLFFLLGVFQTGVLNRFGVAMGTAEPYSSSHPALSDQGFGGLLAMVAWGLWVSRGHLRDVARKALRGAPDVDDSEEMMSYRTAVFGLAGSLVYTSVWLLASGMEAATLALFLPSAFLVFIGVTRIVVEGGLVFVRGPLLPQSFATLALGTAQGTSVPSLISLSMSYGWFSDVKCTFMAAAANASKLVERAGVGRRAVFWGITSSLVVALATSIGYTVYTGYQIGAFNMDVWLFQRAGKLPYDDMVTKILNPTGPATTHLWVMAAGAAFMGVLIFLRYRVSWWPLSPLGFPVAGVQMVRNTAFTIFLAWALKVLLLKIGGNRLYRQALPLFFGLMLGYYAGLGVCWVVDFVWFPGGQGHYLYGV